MEGLSWLQILQRDPPAKPERGEKKKKKRLDAWITVLNRCQGQDKKNR